MLCVIVTQSVHIYCRSPLGLRGLKLTPNVFAVKLLGRSPLGLRGLKYNEQDVIVTEVAAHSGCVD